MGERLPQSVLSVGFVEAPAAGEPIFLRLAGSSAWLRATPLPLTP